MAASGDVSTIEISNFLTRRLGEKEAAEIMLYINTEVEKQVSAKTDSAKQEITTWREEMSKLFATKEAFEKMQVKLIKKVESTLILWSFVFWITQVLAVYCIIKFVR